MIYFFSVAVVLWVLGFVFGYVFCFIRARAELGQAGEMERLSSVLWMGAGNRSWSVVGRLTLAWWLGIPALLLVLMDFLWVTGAAARA